MANPTPTTTSESVEKAKKTKARLTEKNAEKEGTKSIRELVRLTEKGNEVQKEGFKRLLSSVNTLGKIQTKQLDYTKKLVLSSNMLVKKLDKTEKEPAAKKINSNTDILVRLSAIQRGVNRTNTLLKGMGKMLEKSNLAIANALKETTKTIKEKIPKPIIPPTPEERKKTFLWMENFQRFMDRTFFTKMKSIFSDGFLGKLLMANPVTSILISTLGEVKKDMLNVASLFFKKDKKTGSGTSKAGADGMLAFLRSMMPTSLTTAIIAGLMGYIFWKIEEGSSSILKFVKSLFTSTLNIKTSILSPIKKTMETILGGLRRFFFPLEWLAKVLTQGAVGKFPKFFESVGKVFSAIGSVVKVLLVPFEKLFGVISKVGGPVGVFISFVSGFMDMFKSSGSIMKSITMGLITALESLTLQLPAFLFDTVVDGITGLINKIFGTDIKGLHLGQMLLDTINSGWKQLMDIDWSFTKDLIFDGIKSMLQGLWDFIIKMLPLMFPPVMLGKFIYNKLTGNDTPSNGAALTNPDTNKKSGFFDSIAERMRGTNNQPSTTTTVVTQQISAPQNSTRVISGIASRQSESSFAMGAAG